MVSDNPSTPQILATQKPEIPGSKSERQALARKYRRVAILLFALNAISAVLFMSKVNRPVYDDPFNITDVHAYAARGFNVATLLAQTNPPGPTSFLWMAEGVRLLKGDELLDGRIAVLFSWVLLTAGVVIFARHSNSPELWCCALLTVLVFPHTAQASATLLTEGPSILFAVLGVLAWTEFASRATVTPGTLLVGIAGGLSMGIAVTCRQYNLALLPAAAVFAFFQFRRQGQDWPERTRWLVSVIASLVFAVAPVFLLALVWKGLSSPGMAPGASPLNWEAWVGLNIFRPMIAAIYVAVYLVPFSFPVMRSVKPGLRRRLFAVALAGGAVAAYLSWQLMVPGPVHTVVATISRGPILESVLVGSIAIVTIYNACALGLLAWEKRAVALSSPPVAFALLMVLFFVGEQIGVGGNIPFYDRYLLTVAPFLGIVVFSFLPKLTYPRVLALATMSFAGQVMLWRYAFGG